MGCVLAFNEFALQPSRLIQPPGESCQKASGQITRTDSQENGSRNSELLFQLILPPRPSKRRLAITLSRCEGVLAACQMGRRPLPSSDTEYARGLGSRSLIPGVARIFRPGTKADCCLILLSHSGRAARNPKSQSWRFRRRGWSRNADGLRTIAMSSGRKRKPNVCCIWRRDTAERAQMASDEQTERYERDS